MLKQASLSHNTKLAHPTATFPIATLCALALPLSLPAVAQSPAAAQSAAITHSAASVQSYWPASQPFAHRSLATKPKPPAFAITPAADSVQPGQDITLTSSAKKMPKGLTFLLGPRILIAVPIDTRTVKLTFPLDVVDGTYPLRVVTTKGRRKTLFTQDITIERPKPKPPPNNGKIAYAAFTYDDGGGKVFVMNPDGSQQTQFTDTATFEYAPAFSRDGRKLTFLSSPWEYPQSADIIVINADGSNGINLTNTPTERDEEPVLSPDGTKVAFVSNRNGQDHIYIVDIDGSQPRQLTSDPASADRAPVFSPDGTKIAFESHRGLSTSIAILNADGTTPSPINLTAHLATAYAPVWSPDGTKIAFRASNDNGAYGHALYMMSVDGSSVSLLASSPGGDARPVFSPDGTKLAFESYRNMNSDIYIQDLYGTPNSPHRLTDDPQDDRNPVFSPDGTKIAFVANRDGNAEIYVMSLDGTNQTNLTSTPTRGEQIPKWAPALVSDSGVE